MFTETDLNLKIQSNAALPFEDPSKTTHANTSTDTHNLGWHELQASKDAPEFFNRVDTLLKLLEVVSKIHRISQNTDSTFNCKTSCLYSNC